MEKKKNTIESVDKKWNQQLSLEFNRTINSENILESKNQPIKVVDINSYVSSKHRLIINHTLQNIKSF